MAICMEAVLDNVTQPTSHCDALFGVLSASAVY